MTKIIKFFSTNGINFKYTNETKRYHKAHSKTDCVSSIILVNISGKDYLFERPLSGTKTYSLNDIEGNTLCDGRVTTMGFTQDQFIDNVKEYFNIK